MNLVIVIPVYNGFKESISCIESVVKNTASSIPILILDDASPKGNFTEFANKNLKQNKNLYFKRFISNGGYVKAVNFGMKYAELITEIKENFVSHDHLGNSKGKADCILLNSDTIVTKNWIEKLHEAAYSEDKIATVTPYSNNAILASFPRFCRPNKISNSSIERVNSQIEKYSERKYPELPTSMGFCNYIRRDALEVLGLYNEKDFGLGNGEENDFSMRAFKAGYRNILDDATYIYHIGEVSFAERKKDFEEKNGDILNKLHPEYLPKISNFCATDPNRSIRNKTLDKIFIEKNRNNRILHILHNGPYFSRNIEKVGGTELHVQDLIDNLPDCNHFSLVADSENYYLTAYFEELEREFRIKKSNVSLFNLIDRKLFNLVHLHHTLNYDKFELISALKKHGNYLVSAHDYNSICPRNILITPNNQVCTTRECQSACGFLDHYMSEYREKHLDLINNAKQFFCFSNDTLNRLKRVFNSDLENGIVINHGVLASEQKIKQNLINNKIKVLMLGVLAPHKGLNIVKELKDRLSVNNETQIEIHFLGKMPIDPDLDFIINHGEYERENLYDKILAINPHVALLGSICYETYSLTLDELITCGIPVISSSKGAQAERIKKHNCGWILEDFSANNVIKTLLNIVENNKEYKEKLENTKKAKLLSKENQAQQYLNYYSKYSDASIELNSIDFLNEIKRLELKTDYKKINPIIKKIQPYLLIIIQNNKTKSFLKKIIPIKVYFKIKNSLKI